jgi:hypothetical protein
MEILAMVTLQITKDQVFSLLEQLSWAEQQEILQYLSQKLHNQQGAQHSLNELSGKIKAFQGVNALAWQQQIRSEWDETRLSH